MSDRHNHQPSTVGSLSDLCPRPVYLARILLYANAAVWLVLSVFSLARLAGQPGLALELTFIIAILMGGNAAAMALTGLLLGRPRRLWYLAAVALLGINILLTFTDQFGTLDLITLIVDLTATGLLMSGRARSFYFRGAARVDQIRPIHRHETEEVS